MGVRVRVGGEGDLRVRARLGVCHIAVRLALKSQ